MTDEKQNPEPEDQATPETVAETKSSGRNSRFRSACFHINPAKSESRYRTRCHRHESDYLFMPYIGWICRFGHFWWK